jgi:hypothetical protein
VILSGPSEIELNGTIANANFTATPVLPTEYCSPNYSFYVDNQFITNNTSGNLSLQFANVGQFDVEVVALCGYCPLNSGRPSDSRLVTISCSPPLSGVISASGCVSSVGLGTLPLLTLLDNYTLQANVEPSTVNVSNYKFEIRRETEQQWHTLGNSNSKTFSSYAKIAGKFMLRVIVTSNNQDYVSPERALEILFPDYSDIANQSSILNAANISWSSIRNAASTEKGYREEGFMIMLNTKTKTYSTGPTSIGSYFQFPNTPSVSVPLVPDNPTSPTPNSTATYYVGLFHTHTPAFYWPKSPITTRKVGPSSADNMINIPHIVYDYVELPIGSGTIKTGHPLDGLAIFYQAGSSFRRATPQ